MENTIANGYNPMRWNCEKDGCFNVKCRPKIEQFADCFPGRIAVSDIDGIVEINGRLGLLSGAISAHLKSILAGANGFAEVHRIPASHIASYLGLS
jgi:hypothetical protein